MPYKNIVYAKLEKRLLDDPRWYMLSETSQLNYIKLILFAQQTYNRIPTNLIAIRKAFKTNQKLKTIECSLNEIQLAFPKLQKDDKFYYFQDFETKTNYIRECPDNAGGMPKAGIDIDKDKEEDKDKEVEEDTIELSLSKLLFNLIKERDPKYKEPNLSSWAKHINLMIRLDKRTPDEIEKVIRWCQADDFWQNNILLTEKLRKQFNQLFLKMNKEKTNGFKKINKTDWNNFYQMNVGKESFRTQAEFTNSYCQVEIDKQVFYVKKIDQEKFGLKLYKGN